MQSTLPAAAPVDLVMPQDAQLWMNILNWALVAVVLICALVYWRRHGSSIGIWFLLGGALVTFNEPIVDVMGKVWFPAIGTWVFVKVWGISIPIHMVPVYMWFVGGQAFLSYALYRKGITRQGVFGMFAAYAIVDIVLEVPGLNTEVPMYVYHGNHPLVFMKFPLWWCFCNALMPMMIAAVVFRFDSALQGLRRMLIIPMSWPIATATNALTVAPIWIALNIEGSTMELTLLAAIASFGLSLMVCHALSLTVATDSEKKPLHFAQGQES